MQRCKRGLKILINIKEYADLKGVSTQAVYKQLKVHEKELEGHIKKVKGKRYLDEDAVKYLNEQSNNTPSVIVENDTSERLQELEEENKLLKNELINLQNRMMDEILKRDQRVSELTDRFLMLTTQKEEDPKPRWWRFRR